MNKISIIHDRFTDYRTAGITEKKAVEDVENYIKKSLVSIINQNNGDCFFSFVLEPNIGYVIADTLLKYNQKFSPIILPVKNNIRFSKKRAKKYVSYSESCQASGQIIEQKFETKKIDELGFFHVKEYIFDVVTGSIKDCLENSDITIVFSQENVIKTGRFYFRFLKQFNHSFVIFDYVKKNIKIFDKMI